LTAERLRSEVIDWLKDQHAELLPPSM
jgi:hypothetical protein